MRQQEFPVLRAELHDEAAVFRDDGFLLVRKPFMENNVGRDFSTSSFFRDHIAVRPIGYYRASSAFDGTMKRTVRVG